MVEGCPEMGGWGVVAILKEAGRLISKYMRLLHPFILAILLPAALIQLLQLLSLSWIGIPSDEVVPHCFSGVSGHHFRHFQNHHHLHQYHHRHFVFHMLGASSKGQAAPESSTHQPLPPNFLLLLFTTTLTLLTFLLTTLTAAAISQLVQYIYSNKEHEDPLVVQKTFKSLPQSLFRLFITTLWTLSLSLVTYLLLSLPFYLASFLSKPKTNPPFLNLAHSVLVLLALLALALLFLLSLQVAVVEPEKYGLAALQRSVKLIRSSWLTAFGLLVVYFLCVFGLGEIYFATVMVFVSEKVPRWVGYALAFVDAFVYLVVAAYWSVAVAVFYFVSRMKEGGEEGEFVAAENAYVPIAVSAENQETHQRG